MVQITSSPILQMIRWMVEDRRVRDWPDQELLQRFKDKQDQAAFHELLRRHGPMVLDVCRGVLGNDANAEDAFQATFIVLARKAGSIRKSMSLGCWLHGVAYRTALKARVQAARRKKYETRPPERQVSAADDLSWQEVRQALHEELSKLPDRYRDPLVLCHLESATQDAAAVQLGVAKSTLKIRLERGRTLLRNRLLLRGMGPSALLAVAAWPCANALASLSTKVVARAVEAATTIAAGGEAASVVPARVVSLAEGVIRVMFITKAKLITAALLLCLLTTGTMVVMAQVQAAEPRSKVKSSRQATAKQELPKAQSKEPAAIGGVVADEKGETIPGATVLLARGDLKGKTLVATSDADGRFGFPKHSVVQERTPSFVYQLAAGKEGYAPTMGVLADIATTDASNPANQNLILRLTKAGTISGSVRDGNGRPVAGARIQFGVIDESGGYGYLPSEVLMGSALEAFHFTRSDANGNFKFTTVPADKGLIFRVQADGFADLDTSRTGTKQFATYFAKERAAPVALVLGPEGRISGRVVTSLPGVSVKDLHVFTQPAGGDLMTPYKQTSTDALGQFTFAGMPECRCNILMDDPPSGAKWTMRMAPGAALRPGVTTEVKIELIEGVVVEGLVVLESTHQPVEGAVVGVHSPARPITSAAIDGATTDENGRYRLRLPPGESWFYVQSTPVGFAKDIYSLKNLEGHALNS